MTPKTGDKIQVLIIDDVAETRENLRKLLSFEPDVDVVGAAGSGQEGIELAKQFEPHIVLMDINMPGMDGIAATELLLQEVSTAQVVMLSVQGETDYLRRAMLAGARDYLTKPASAGELINTIHRVYEMAKTQVARVKTAEQAALAVSEKKRKPERLGAVVAVYGPKGGVGCTTVAVNLAIALQELIGAEQRIALLDANLQFGDVGVMLNLQASRSIADLASRVVELDDDMLDSVMTAHGSGIKVLLAPPRPEAAEGLLIEATTDEDGRSAFEAIMDLMRSEFDIIIVDVGSWLDDVALTVFDAAALIALVTTPHIPAIKSARLFLEVASKLDYPMDKVALVINGVERRGGIQVEQIEKAMIPVTAQIPLDRRAALTSANRGVPFVRRDRSEDISQKVFGLAESIRDMLLVSEDEENGEAEAKPAAKGVGGTGLLRLKQAFERR